MRPTLALTLALLLAAPAPLRAQARHRSLARAVARRAAATAARRAPPPPLPRVALQLAGLRVTGPLSRSAVLHALERDAWPALVRCVTPSVPARGYAQVALAPELRLEGAPLTRSVALRECVSHALERVVMPPHELGAAGPSVSFDLAFGMPPVGTPPRAAR